MTTTPEAPVYEYEPWGKFIIRSAKAIFRIACWVFGSAMVVSVAMFGYDQLDENGCLSHDVLVDVYMSNEWIVGENRLCTLTEFPDNKGKPNGHPLGVTCPSEDRKLDPHNVSVTLRAESTRSQWQEMSVRFQSTGRVHGELRTSSVVQMYLLMRRSSDESTQEVHYRSRRNPCGCIQDCRGDGVHTEGTRLDIQRHMTTKLLVA